MNPIGTQPGLNGRLSLSLSAEMTELPHFSCPHLVSRFALVENLDFLFYLRHGRPSFAYATFLMQQLSSCSDVTQL